MKKELCKFVVMTFVIGIFAITGCGKSESNTGDGKSESNTDEFWLKMGDNSIVSTSDIDFYDVSLHTIYLKKKVSYLKNVHGTVSVYVGDEKIYELSIHSAICSHIPMGQPYIWDITSNEEKVCILFNPSNEQQVDPRSDKRIIEALKKNHLYRE